MDPLSDKYPGLSPYNYVLNNPLTLVDPDGESPIRALMSAGRLIRRAYRIYQRTGKLTPESLKRAGLDEIVDYAGDLYTIFSGDATTVDIISAGVDLLIGTDLNKKGDKAAADALGLSKLARKNRTVDDLILDSKPGKPTKGRAKNYERSGGMDQANKEFDGLNPADVKEIPGGRTGKLEDGRTVVVRDHSDDGRPTLEVQDGKNRTKFRYDE